jgi:hypothetical protein
MALGSIEHLQHYFTKTGLIAKKECVPPSFIRSFADLIAVPGPTPKERALSPHSGP